MPKASIEKLEKVTLNIFEGDKDTLAAFHPKLGWSVAARLVIQKYCNQLREEGNSIERRPVAVVIKPLENSE